MTFAGIPPPTLLAGISFVTTAFAPITTLSPITTFPTTFAPGYKTTLSPIVGDPDFPHTFPIVHPQ